MWADSKNRQGFREYLRKDPYHRSIITAVVVGAKETEHRGNEKKKKARVHI